MQFEWKGIVILTKMGYTGNKRFVQNGEMIQMMR